MRLLLFDVLLLIRFFQEIFYLVRYLVIEFETFLVSKFILLVIDS